MTAYLKKMGINLRNAGSTSGGGSNDIGDGGTGVETGVRVDTMIESARNMDSGRDGLELVSGPEPESPGTATVTPLTDEEFLMVNNA